MAAVPDSKTFVNGVLDSSDLNTYIRDPIRFLLRPPMAELVQIVAQSIPNTALTAITFTSHTVDQDYLGGTGHSDSVNPSRYTANWQGWYEVSGQIGYSASAVGRRHAGFAVNGSMVNGSASMLQSTATAECCIPAHAKHIFLNVGDYVELYAFQDSGGALNTNGPGSEASSMSVRWVSN